MTVLRNDEGWADWRSDTVTRPTPAMRAAMAEAPVGDDVYGEDPTVAALEEAVADRLGKEAGVFFPSGTQSNLAAILCHCGRGDEMLTGQGYHVERYEAGGASALGGVVIGTLPAQPDGGLTAEAVAAAVKPDDFHMPVSRLLSLENTVYGQALPVERIAAPAAAAREAGLAAHLDGARIFNAAVALGETPAALAAPVDTVSVCLSKGLGAPVGTVLCGPSAFAKAARRARKMLGGGMRQVGVIAAAGLYALEHHIARLAEDHDRARRLAEALAPLSGIRVERFERPTNMAYVALPDAGAAARLEEAMAERRVKIASGSLRLRFVAHLDIDDDGLERTIAGFRAVFG